MPRISDRYRVIESDWTPYVTVTSNDTTADATTVTGNSTYWTYNDDVNDNRVVNLHDYWQEIPTYNYIHSDNLNNYITLDRSNSIWSDNRLFWDPDLSFEEAYKRWLKNRNKKRVIRI